MKLSVNITFQDLVEIIKQMNLSELEKLKDTIIENELYFKKYEKAPLSEVINDFRKEGYSENFLNDLENGLKKSSVYNEN